VNISRSKSTNLDIACSPKKSTGSRRVFALAFSDAFFTPLPHIRLSSLPHSRVSPRDQGAADDRFHEYFIGSSSGCGIMQRRKEPIA
jgi:hypothetical protein